MHITRFIVSCSALLLYSQTTFAADFPACLPVIQNVQNITADEKQFFVSLEPDRPLLTLAGCEHFCGTGIQIWPAQDTLGRLVLWVLPVTVLIAHYHFGPLSVRGKIAVVAHLLGDPIDSLWSLLTRQEVYRRLYHRSKKVEPKLADDIATIWAAYDEVGWQDASTHTLQKDIISRLKKLTLVQEFSIREAGSMLVSNHSESKLGTWISIFALSAALLGAYVRTWTANLNDQTAHTLAIVSLFFHCIALVKISGNIGAFTTSSAPLYVLLNLRWKLRNRCQRCAEPEIFPRPDFRATTPRIYIPPDQENSQTSLTHDEKSGQPMLQSWQGIAAGFGMNSLWRPRKVLLIKSPNPGEDRGSVQLLLYSLAFTVIGSYLPAFFLSYFTNNFGFGCHDLAWTLILVTWILSMIADEILKHYIKDMEKLWFWTRSKDFVIVLSIISAMLVSQIGPMNSCFCKAKIVRGGNAVVDLGPFTEEQYLRGYIPWVSAPVGGFLATMLLLFLVGRGSEHGRRLLNKSREERDSQFAELQTLRDELMHRKTFKPLSPACDNCTPNSEDSSGNTDVEVQAAETAPSDGHLERTIGEASSANKAATNQPAEVTKGNQIELVELPLQDSEFGKIDNED
jgi:hypothetical protein